MSFDLDWLVKNYASFFEKFGIGNNELVAHFNDWKAQRKSSSVTDYLWYLFHVLLGETRKQVTQPADYHRNLDEIYIKILEFRTGVEGQKDNPLIRQIIRNRIQQWQHELSKPFRLQAISIDCCPYCERINGQVFDVEQVLQEPYFASDQCTKESGCSCGYIPVAITESN
jgi:hypothetical protein